MHVRKLFALPGKLLLHAKTRRDLLLIADDVICLAFC
jgi:hypothetical protein